VVAVEPAKVAEVIEFESSRAFGDVWALNCLWSELGFDRLGTRLRHNEDVSL
jgi:hypothetical protein